MVQKAFCRMSEGVPNPYQDSSRILEESSSAGESTGLSGVWSPQRGDAMIYKDFQGLKLSALGMGCMRLPVGEGDADVDVATTQRMVDYALEHGVNYFDTAWGYHGGTSETVIGEALAKHPRESFYLATKFPGYDPSNWGEFDDESASESFTFDRATGKSTFSES